ncbi:MULTISPECIES: hypothetical protein [Xanthomonas]|uniref:hypothetical protein n=1 Tax=Xanthomonas TaxID=338 RepID=UPI00141B5D3F|nr:MULTISPECIES: hypothetical protein [Xanthomonas]
MSAAGVALGKTARACTIARGQGGSTLDAFVDGDNGGRASLTRGCALPLAD